MRTASIFKNGKNQAIRLPKDFEFTGVKEVIIVKDGDSLIISPKRKSWLSLMDGAEADADFLTDREEVFEEGRINL